MSEGVDKSKIWNLRLNRGTFVSCHRNRSWEKTHIKHKTDTREANPFAKCLPKTEEKVESESEYNELDQLSAQEDRR